MFHLVAHLISSLFKLGDYQMIRDSFVSTLPFYAAMFATYLGKSIFENYDRYTKKFTVDMKKLDIEEETIINNCGNG